jgi:hypothetical protein
MRARARVARAAAALNRTPSRLLLLHHCEIANCATLLLYISASIALLYAKLGLIELYMYSSKKVAAPVAVTKV